MSKFLDDLLSVGRKVAPSILGAAATAAGGPASGLVVKSIMSKILGKPSADMDDEQMAEAIITDPGKLSEFKLKLQELELEELKLRMNDTQNARESHKDSYGPVVISTIVVVGFVSAIYTILGEKIPDANENLMFMLLGTLAAGFSQVLNFWLGSSQGSKEKNKTMHMFAGAKK